MCGNVNKPVIVRTAIVSFQVRDMIITLETISHEFPFCLEDPFSCEKICSRYQSASLLELICLQEELDCPAAS